MLSQATLSTIPNYTMQCMALPSKVTQSVNRLCRNFIWGTTENRRKLHLVGWKKITKAKSDGGLGLQSVKERNIALLAKLNWRFHKDRDSLWARVLIHKYFNRRRQNLFKPRICSPTWTTLSKDELVFKRGVEWIIGTDSSFSFWNNKWLNDGALRGLIAGPFQRGEDSLLLKDVYQAGFWNLEALSFPIPFTMAAASMDWLSWCSSPNGDFDLKEAYKLAIMENDIHHHENFSGNWVWKSATLPKIRCFLWQCLHNSIPVREILVARDLNIPHFCPLCGIASE